MTTINLAIESIEVEINELKAKLQARVTSLEVLKETALRIASLQESVPVQTNVKIASTGVIDLSSLRPESAGKTTFIDEVKSTVARFGNQEFSITETEAALKQLNVVIKSNSPKAKISTVLNKLQESGMLVKTFEGKGNVAHRYQLSKEFSNTLA